MSLVSSFPSHPTKKLHHLRLFETCIGFEDREFTWGSLSHLLHLFASIQSLHISMARNRPEHGRRMPSSPPQRHLTQVELLDLSINGDSVGMCQQLSKSIQVDQVGYLRLTTGSQREVRMAAAYNDSEAVLPHIKHLELHLPILEGVEAPLFLAVASALKSVRYVLNLSIPATASAFVCGFLHVGLSLSTLPVTVPLSLVYIQLTMPLTLLNSWEGNRSRSLRSLYQRIGWTHLISCVARLPAVQIVRIEVVVLPQPQPSDVIQDLVDFFHGGLASSDYFRRGEDGASKLEISVT
ncbi:hypothetical protein EIP91_010270 [Steccherinum ochraceum]|uniref:Uncharacterized protein n=1 Tax=Steccherinum ochraceum TaxID=92696 RepID=A0A4R0RQW9_9APHY|nr:hypothetical protein EIP91_010270 [Steccherinum ochraceum]